MRVGVALAVLAIGLAMLAIWYQRGQIHQNELQSSEMYARVLEDHANRTFNAVSVTMTAVVQAFSIDAPSLTQKNLGPALQRASQGQPFLRSLSLVDGTGLVLASSSEGNVNVRLDLKRVPLPKPGAFERLGAMTAGRDISEATIDRDAVGSFAGRFFIPVTRAAFLQEGVALYLVAAVSPDYFANEHHLILGDESWAASVVAIDGTALSVTDGIGVDPGQRIVQHRFFDAYLPVFESGSFVGPGIGGRKVVTAFRLLRALPLLVMVERDYARVWADILRMIGSVLGVCVACLIALSGMVTMARRSLKVHRKVQQTLAETRERVATREKDLRTLVHSVHELIFRAETGGHITFVNTRWQVVSGRPESAAIGHRLADFCTPDSREAVNALFDGNLAQSSEVVMARLETPIGEIRILEVSVSRVGGGAESMAGFAGFAVDVSERELARGQLQSQLEFTARLLDVNPTPLFVKDDQGVFLKVNRAWLDLMGMAEREVLGRDSSQVFGEHGMMHIERDQAPLYAGQPVIYENRLSLPDQPARDTVVTKVPFSNSDGTRAGIIGSIVDVTEFREAERTTREARDAAEASNRAKSEFIANITHELRTPLQSIIGFSDLGVEMAAVQPDLQEMFVEILAGGKRMLTLVNGLLDVAKIEKVAAVLLSRQNVATLMAEVVRELWPIASQRTLRIQLPLTLPVLFADVEAFRIKQVFRNVLANAMRFAPEGSSIAITLRESLDHGVEVLIRDQGPGIPHQELETIFDAFVQSSRTSDGSGGTGLGLTICRKIMQAHGGSIRAANAVGGGAEFAIWLPSVQTIDSASRPVASTAEPLVIS